MKDNPATPSSDYEAMAPYWRQVNALMGGVAAMRDAGKTYLPKYEAETEDAYEDRRKGARFTNIFRDIVENLAQRPFKSEVVLDDDAPGVLSEYVEDVDGKGNNLHVFAASVFFDGIANAVDYILVDHAPTRGGMTVAEERRQGVRPFWVRYPAESVLAAYTAQVAGREEFVHVRLREDMTERDGWKEVHHERVRIFNREPLADGQYGPATWELWEKSEKGEWTPVEGQAGPVTLGVIPLVPFVTGRRIGGWRFYPPMRDAADLQIEYYQQENALKNAKLLTAFPMLAGNGVSPEYGDDGKPMPLIVGPSTVLYAPGGDGGSASWEFVEPGATSLKFLADDLEATARELRELGRQPLTAQSGNLTVVTTAFAAQKGNSAVQAWALSLKDALENALRYTAMWLNVPDEKATVSIDTDFDLGLGDDDSFVHVLEMHRDGALDYEAMIHEAKRRGIIDKDFDPADDAGDFDADTSDEDGAPGGIAQQQGADAP